MARLVSSHHALAHSLASLAIRSKAATRSKVVILSSPVSLVNLVSLVSLVNLVSLVILVSPVNLADTLSNQVLQEPQALNLAACSPRTGLLRSTIKSPLRNSNDSNSGSLVLIAIAVVRSLPQSSPLLYLVESRLVSRLPRN